MKTPVLYFFRLTKLLNRFIAGSGESSSRVRESKVCENAEDAIAAASAAVDAAAASAEFISNGNAEIA